MEQWKRIWLVGIVCLFIGGTSLAQVTTGTLSGTVKDDTGAVVPGAQIVLLSEETGSTRTVHADTAGRYSASSLSLGNYRITATREGFQTQVRSGIVLTVGREAVVDIVLSVGAVTQTVEVVGDAPTIDTTNATVSGLVNQEQIRELPLNGRSYSDLALLSPGVFVNRTVDTTSMVTGSGLSVNGSGSKANLYLIDGTVANDAIGQTTTAAGASLGVEGIREFRLLTHNYGAEYGRNSGAVMSVVTRSGTNQFHGSVYEFVRNNVFDARDFFTQGSLQPFRRNQFGAAAGGPVIKDRIFFFANYEGLRQRQARTTISSVPDANARQGLLPNPTTGVLQQVTLNQQMVPYLNLYPLPNLRNFGDGTGQYAFQFSVPTNEDYALGRMDLRLSDKDNLYGRYIYDDSNVTVPQTLPLWVVPNQANNYFAVLSETHIFSATALNDFRVAFNRTVRIQEAPAGAQVDPSLSFVPGLDFGSISIQSPILVGLGPSVNRPTTTNQNLFQTGDDFTLVRGAHSLKFGADFERVDYNMIFGPNSRGAFRFASLQTFLAGTPNLLSGVIGSGASGTRGRGHRRDLISWFIQDDYRLSSRLTLNLGLRHEFFTDDQETHGRTASLRNITDPASTVGPPFQAAKMNFAPRVGLAWDPTGSGKTSIRAGAGVYFDQVDGFNWGFFSSGEYRFYTGYTVTNPTTFPRLPANPAVTTVSEQSVQWQLATPTTVQYSLDLQRQLTRAVKLELGYVGAYGYNQPRSTMQNIRIPQILSDGSKFWAGNEPFVNPNFSTIQQFRADAVQNYNGLQASVQGTAGAGLAFQASYTYSKALSESDGANPGVVRNDGGIYNTMDINDLGRDYGLSANDQRQTFVFNGLYKMPWDRMLNGRLAKGLLGGWEINGIYQYGSGLPLSAVLGFNNSRNGDTLIPDRPNLAPGASSNSPTNGVTAGCPGIPAGQQLGTPGLWFDPCAFVLPPAGTFGNLGRDTIAGPNYNQMNFTLAKKTALTEHMRLEFRAEFFNLFNHPSFGFPALKLLTSSGVHASGEGVITSTNSQGRQIQLGLKLTF